MRRRGCTAPQCADQLEVVRIEREGITTTSADAGPLGLGIELWQVGAGVGFLAVAALARWLLGRGGRGKSAKRKKKGK